MQSFPCHPYQHSPIKLQQWQHYHTGNNAVQVVGDFILSVEFSTNTYWLQIVECHRRRILQTIQLMLFN